MPHLVTITRTITRVIRVEGFDKNADARQQIEDYGPDLAWNDYPGVVELEKTRVVSVKKEG